jgi:uncharacterized membrane protein AbrB (regulator of aidB expression)
LITCHLVSVVAWLDAHSVDEPLRLNGFGEVFLGGFFGGIVGDLVNLHEARETGPPVYVKKIWYWFCMAFMAVLGGLLACLYGVHEVQAILAANIGASAPVLLKAIATGATKPPRVD